MLFTDALRNVKRLADVVLLFRCLSIERARRSESMGYVAEHVTTKSRRLRKPNTSPTGFLQLGMYIAPQIGVRRISIDRRRLKLGKPRSWVVAVQTLNVQI
jgi:hypothetical protein